MSKASRDKEYKVNGGVESILLKGGETLGEGGRIWREKASFATTSTENPKRKYRNK